MPYDQYGNQTQGYSDGQMWGGVASGALGGLAAGATFGPVGAAVGGLLGAGVGLYSGLSEKAKAKKLQGDNLFPTQAVPQGIQQNAQEAQRLSLQGLPSAQYKEAMTNIERQQATAIMAAQQRRAGMDAVSTINQSTNDAQLQLTGQDAAARRQNIQSGYEQNQTLGQYQNNAFDWNQRQRYIANYNYAMALAGAGNQNLIRGLDTGISGIVRGLGGMNWGGGGGQGGAGGFSFAPSSVGIASAAGSDIPMIQRPG